MIDQITAISVSYKHKKLIETSVNSIKKFYPDLKFIIVENSEPNSECRNFVQNVLSKDKNISCIYSGSNIGHGRGMHSGINAVKTKYALIFDSDIEMIKPPIEEMFQLLKNNYGVGHLLSVDMQGLKTTSIPAISYLHPYFCLISVEQYRKFKPFFHHGAPCLSAMYDLHKQNKSNLLIKFSVSKYIKHDFGGTSNLERKIGNVTYGIGAWDKL